MKKFLSIITDPVRFFGNRGFADKIVKFFDQKRYLVYVLAAIITLFILFVKYIVPNL